MRYQWIKLASVWAIALVVWTLALLATGCGSDSGDGGPDSIDLTGTYNGEVVIANSSPFVSVVTTLTVSSDGTVSGTTTGLPDSGAPGEQGTITGSIEGSDPVSMDFDLVFESATLGSFTATGKGIYATATGEIAASLTGKKDDVFVGDFLISVMKE